MHALCDNQNKEKFTFTCAWIENKNRTEGQTIKKIYIYIYIYCIYFKSNIFVFIYKLSYPCFCPIIH